jgi:hypothetical protein
MSKDDLRDHIAFLEDQKATYQRSIDLINAGTIRHQSLVAVGQR